MIGRLPFDHDRQLASVVVRGPSERRLIIKGAPEQVLARCGEVSAGAHDVLERLFGEGERVVALATRDADGLTAPRGRTSAICGSSGFLTFVDPPKRDAGDAIARLGAMGIAVKIITGDNGLVARKVCREIGMQVGGRPHGRRDRRDRRRRAGGGHSRYHDLRARRARAEVAADQGRTQEGVDVGFLGDGVNDAVALHSADVGISVDTATDVAKDAADIVLLDKDLGVLADGVMEGRRIFANTLKYVLMATSSNFGNMFSAAGASLFLSFLPMLPSQILLNNLLYDAGQMAIPGIASTTRCSRAPRPGTSPSCGASWPSSGR